jgi:hypothetical protein
MWVEDWRQSGSSLWKYAKANGLNPQTFSKWTKGTEKETAPNFIEIKPVPEKLPAYIPEILIRRRWFNTPGACPGCCSEENDKNSGYGFTKGGKRINQHGTGTDETGEESAAGSSR